MRGSRVVETAGRSRGGETSSPAVKKGFLMEMTGEDEER
jgi:hypothetical protein